MTEAMQGVCRPSPELMDRELSKGQHLLVEELLKGHGVWRQRGSKMPGDERFNSAHSPPSTSHDAPMQSPGSSSISCR